MKITGVMDVKVRELAFVDLRGSETKCPECLEFFQDGDKVFVLGDSTYKESGVEVSEDVVFVHATKRENGHYCLEDYVQRLIQKLEGKEKPKEPEKP